MLLGELQSQSQDTERTLASYTDKFHVLESLITQHNDFTALQQGGLEWR